MAPDSNLSFGVLALQASLIDPAQFADRLVSGMSDAIVYADAEGVIRRWNRGASRIFGFAEAEAIGRSLDIIIAAGLRERHWQAVMAPMRLYLRMF